MPEERYECVGGEYCFAKPGDLVIVDERGQAKSEDGDVLAVDVALLRVSPDFNLVSGGKKPTAPPPPAPQVYAIAAKINRTFATIDEAKVAASEAIDGEAYIVRLIGKMKVTKSVEYQPLEGK
jgi:hypothetical protein